MGYNSTIRVKQKICISCGKPCFWFSKKRCQQCTKVEDYFAKEAQIQQEEDGLPELIERLDGLVSKWVRYSRIEKDGLVQCFTCSGRFPASELDAGHYISRNCMHLRFDAERNIRPQCRPDNRAKYGKSTIFGQNLEKELPGVTDLLFEEKWIIYKWSREELRSLIADYSQRIKLLK